MAWQQMVHRRRAMATLKVRPAEAITDAAPVYPAVLDELVPSAWHHVERHANNRVEAEHSQLKMLADVSVG
jgi:IS6 family transposase